ncbi:hypothetical protein ABL78_2066 [Leptomonas seymouri]|uniref:EF-hand domain-containing protein n=1 Tax=Leptomonas seymouri TaxID=5684 RepID=A0A0N0P7V6_LEPSE|nr:hypothetical protein ABL78_2066 [Leptomonas seymouri]|eukprot:KPI88807.1 hypothetical protein ABL78_2066 [Leptomonas seymouri]
MPSLVFTRKQVLGVLSDEAARREQEAIPDFIYLFLRDVFYAADVDGDGYVTADALWGVLPSFLSAKASPTSSPVPPAASPSPNDIHCCNETHQSFMAPGVWQTWGSPASFLVPRGTAYTPRPLDLCGFMKTFWPHVSELMARLVGDTWSQQSSGSESSVEREPNNSKGKGSRVRNSSCRATFSPSPFRGVPIVSPPRNAASPHNAEKRRGTAEVSHSPDCFAMPQPFNNEGIALEQQRLYHEAVHRLWGTMDNTPPNSSQHAHLVSYLPPRQPHAPCPPPLRLFSDEQVEQFQIAFAYLDKNSSGFISSSEVAEALQSLLDRVAGCDTEGGNNCRDSSVAARAVKHVRDDVKDAADAMLRLALSSTTCTTSDGRGSSMSCIPATSVNSPFSESAAGDRCVSLPIFIRSFQCESGAFPAELIAWCVSCSVPLRSGGRAFRTSPQNAHRLAHSIQWMSPLECALMQQTLERYAAQISACLWDEKCEAAETKDASENSDVTATVEHSVKVVPHGLSQRLMINVQAVAKSVGRQASKSADGQTALLCNGGAVNEVIVEGVAQWCSCLRSCSGLSSQADSNLSGKGSFVDAAVLPLTVLEASLLHDARGALFSNAFDFSMAEGTAAEAVLWNHVQAVCTLARRIAVVEAPPFSPELIPSSAETHSTTVTTGTAGVEAPLALIDVKRLAEVISTDPRNLSLEVLVPLSARLEAVVDAAQRLPRCSVEQAVQAVSDHLSSHNGRGTTADVQQPGASTYNFTHILELRRRLMTISPPLARLITGATRFVNRRLALHDCLAVLSTQMLSVPPLRRPYRHYALNKWPEVEVPQRPKCVPGLLPSAEMCAALLERADILKASRGWLRYACRRIPPQESRDIISALRHNAKAGLYEAVRAMVAVRTESALQAPQTRLHDYYAVLFVHVCASCWTCRVELVVAAHVTLILLVSACTVPENVVGDETLWWCHVRSSLEEWVDGQWTAEGSYASDTWAMSAFWGTSAEIGMAACRSISRGLCQLRSEPHGFSHSVVVNEEALSRVLTHIIDDESLWAASYISSAVSSTAHEACRRLGNAIVGCCPSRAGALVDITQLLRRWLEMCPLPLPVKYLSLCCPVAEVESIYYTLKRLAASEANKRRRSGSPRSRAASLLWAEDAPAVVVTGITPVCLAELLENDAVLAALYAVSPPRSLGLWSGSLCYLETVLRPVLLSATGFRVSLRRLHEDAITADRKEAENKSSDVAKEKQLTSTASTTGDDAWSELLASSWWIQSVLVAMALPPVLQHSVAQLFHLVDADATGAVTEDQLRNYRHHVPAAARYGWHRFVTMLCCRSMSSSPMLLAGGFSTAVLRSHCWRRRGVGEGESGMEEGLRASSVVTQGTDDMAATYTLGGLLARVGELRACVQAQLLEEANHRTEVISSPVKPPSGGTESAKAAPASAVTDDTTTPKASTAGTAQWWFTYLEVLCRSYSALPL